MSSLTSDQIAHFEEHGYVIVPDVLDCEQVARYRDRDIARLLKDEGIVRNRAKIEATIANARAFQRLSERTSLRAFQA